MYKLLGCFLALTLLQFSVVADDKVRLVERLHAVSSASLDRHDNKVYRIRSSRLAAPKADWSRFDKRLVKLNARLRR